MATAAGSLSGRGRNSIGRGPSRSAQSELENQMSIIEGFRNIGRAAALGAAVLAAVSLTVTPGTPMRSIAAITAAGLARPGRMARRRPWRGWRRTGMAGIIRGWLERRRVALGVLGGALAGAAIAGAANPYYSSYPYCLFLSLSRTAIPIRTTTVTGTDRHRCRARIRRVRGFQPSPDDCGSPAPRPRLRAGAAGGTPRKLPQWRIEHCVVTSMPCGSPVCRYLDPLQFLQSPNIAFSRPALQY